MDDLKAIQLIQQYRHDVLNQIQLLSGYLSMKETVKAEEKLNEWIHYFEEERRLTSLNISKFALWIIQFNINHRNMRLTYTIAPSGINYERFDELLYRISNAFIHNVELIAEDNMLCEVFLNLREDKDELYLEISVDATNNQNFKEVLMNFESFESEIKVIKQSLEQDHIAYQFVIANRER